MSLVSQKLCMTKDLGLNGNLFGGYMLCWLDEAGAIFVHREFPGNLFVTFKMMEVAFKKPVKEGDITTILADVKRVGLTSVTIELKATNLSTCEVVCSTTMIFVSVCRLARKRQLFLSEEGKKKWQKQ